MTYRNDHDAALARIDALEAELVSTQSELALSRVPSRTVALPPRPQAAIETERVIRLPPIGPTVSISLCAVALVVGTMLLAMMA